MIVFQRLIRQFIPATTCFKNFCLLQASTSSVASPSTSLNLTSSKMNGGGGGGGGISEALRLPSSTKYSRLSSEPDSPMRSSSSTGALIQQQIRQQDQLLQYQDRQIGAMSESMGNLRNVSNAIGRELDEQAVRFLFKTYFPNMANIKLLMSNFNWN